MRIVFSIMHVRYTSEVLFFLHVSMEIITVHNSDITEPCPRIETLDAMGFYRPSVRQIETLFSRETGNLLESLSDIVTWGDAVATLASATIFRLVFLGHLSAPF